MQSRKPSIFKDSAMSQVYNTPGSQKKKASMLIVNESPLSPNHFKKLDGGARFETP